MPKRLKKIIFRVAALLFSGVALWQLGGAGLIAAKAFAAPILIESAWDESLITGKPMKPWSWADTHPIAKLHLAEKNITRYVMAGDNMRALAFGPMQATVARTPIYFGHRDTHFAFLEHLSSGDVIEMQNASGTTSTYKVEKAWTAHKDAMFMPSSTASSQLMLVTCYPFGTVQTSSDERFIVQAVKL